MSRSTADRRGSRLWLALGVWVVMLQLVGLHLHLSVDGVGPHQSLHWEGSDFDDALPHEVVSRHDSGVCVDSPFATRQLVDALALPTLVLWLLTGWLRRPSAMRSPRLRAAAGPACPIYRFLPPAHAPPC
ncbi:MAG TPA: hypothetical protein VMF64_06215 [Steroidobacteraceae bacterium]|nr:hypothetical protein [Steroidobacteraceae bacterium]